VSNADKERWPVTEHDPLTTYFELEEELADINSAKAAILPVPYDKTATWKKGAARAPKAILEASHHIERYDVVTGIEPCKWGIATLNPSPASSPANGASRPSTRSNSTDRQKSSPIGSTPASPS
jgi:arginase family enzyme